MNFEKYGIDISKARNGKTFCPKCHSDRKKSAERELSIDLVEGLFNCHHCGFKGCVKEFERTERPKKEFKRPEDKPVVAPTSKVIQWFASRGITERTLIENKICERKEWMPQVNGERNCICFPYYRNGELINVKYRDGEKNFKLVKDAELIFFGLDTLLAYPDRAVITEGEIDALTLHEVKVRAAILSVPNGASKGSQRLEYVDNCWKHFENVKEIIIATDGDAPGVALREELARRFGKEKCFYLNYPEGCKDLNDVLKKSGTNAVREVIKSAVGFPLEGVETSEDIYEAVKSILQNGYPDGLRSGWESFDKLLRFNDSGFTVITGIPGSGKSTWLNNLLVRMARKHEWRIGMFSPEMQPNEILIAQLVELVSGKGIRRDLGIDEFNQAMGWLADHFWLMKIDEIDVTIDGLLEKGAELVKYYGINALVIDPYNYIEHKYDKGQNETQYISELLTKVKRFKDRYKVHVFFVCHPTKIKKMDNGMYYLPTLYDIAGSAHFYNKCDNGIVVHLNNGVTEVHVQKVRWWFLGEKGTANLHYDKTTRLFHEHQSTQFPVKPF